MKKALQEAYPDVEIKCHSAGSMTGKIEVAWIDDGKKNIIWAKNKADTEANHATILANLKSAA